MEEIPLKTFSSPTSPFHRIQYRYLNPEARNTLIFCYGAGASSISIFYYDAFIKNHPSLSILCIERWTLPASEQSSSQTSTVSRSGLALFSELTAMTLGLLDKLQIQKFSIAAHSGGVYSMLDLAARCRNTDRVQNLLLLGAHIPEKLTQSKLYPLVRRAPEPVFDFVTKLDSNPPAWLAKIFTGQATDQDGLVDTPELRREIEGYKPTAEEMILRDERRRLDYGAFHERLPGVDHDLLLGMYRELATASSRHVSWFLCEADMFFGPTSAERLLNEIGAKNEVNVIVVENASHADIHLRSVVWEEIFQRVTAK